MSDAAARDSKEQLGKRGAEPRRLKLSAPSNTCDFDRVSLLHAINMGHGVNVIEETKMHAVRMPLVDAGKS